jgi:hypothetical protein
MRTLGTQVRLKRLLRVQAELAERLAQPEADGRLARVTARRLHEVVADVRSAWQVDRASVRPGDRLLELERHVARCLGTLEAAAARHGIPGEDPVRLSAEFRETAVPLLFFLRGIEDTSDQALLAWLAPMPSSRSA